MLPRPINPIVAMAAPPAVCCAGSFWHRRHAAQSRRALRECQLAVAERREIALYRRRVDLGQRRRPPCGALVAVDDQRAHALVEIVPGHDVLAHAGIRASARPRARSRCPRSSGAEISSGWSAISRPIPPASAGPSRHRLRSRRQAQRAIASTVSAAKIRSIAAWRAATARCRDRRQSRRAPPRRPRRRPAASAAISARAARAARNASPARNRARRRRRAARRSTPCSGRSARGNG